jgi:hypothetical protein
MVITQRNLADRLVDNHIQRVLHRGDPPPTWTGTAAEWEDLYLASERHLRLKAAFELADLIANKGWTPAELLSGNLTGSARVAASGQVVRPQPSTASGLIARASDLLLEVQRYQIRLSGSLAVNLESIARGGWDGIPQQAQNIVNSVQATVETARAQHQAQLQKSQKDTQYRVRVLESFHGGNGQHWPQGEYRLSQSQVDELHRWASRHEAQAQLRQWDIPSGFGQWPVFQVLLAE